MVKNGKNYERIIFPHFVFLFGKMAFRSSLSLSCSNLSGYFVSHGDSCFGYDTFIVRFVCIVAMLS